MSFCRKYLIYYYHPETGGTPSYKLFNLKSDPYEHQDVATDYPDVARRMCRRMMKRLKTEHALFPVTTPQE